MKISEAILTAPQKQATTEVNQLNLLPVLFAL